METTAILLKFAALLAIIVAPLFKRQKDHGRTSKPKLSHYVVDERGYLDKVHQKTLSWHHAD